jgi:hypothetical protein
MPLYRNIKPSTFKMSRNLKKRTCKTVQEITNDVDRGTEIRGTLGRMRLVHVGGLTPGLQEEEEDDDDDDDDDAVWTGAESSDSQN